MSDATTQPPADVRDRIIRASILPFEDEETMIAGLRAGAEAVERGELDVDDFVGVWSQYLRELFRRASSVRAPADVRERVAKAVYLWEATRFGAAESWALRSWEQESNTRRELYFNVADRILALLRTPRGEGEEDGGEFCDLCGEMFDPSELGTVIGPLGEDDGVPRWYRCPRCARAYDAGYQQGQRDPRGDETADPTAPRSEAQGEDRWEDLIFSTLIEAYNEAQRAARRGEGGGE